jgi:hypothetical protein
VQAARRLLPPFPDFFASAAVVTGLAFAGIMRPSSQRI